MWWRRRDICRRHYCCIQLNVISIILKKKNGLFVNKIMYDLNWIYWDLNKSFTRSFTLFVLAFSSVNIRINEKTEYLPWLWLFLRLVNLKEISSQTILYMNEEIKHLQMDYFDSKITFYLAVYKSSHSHQALFISCTSTNDNEK